MKLLGVDIHTVLGAGGLLASVSLAQVNQVIGCGVGLATFVYMVCRAGIAWREWRGTDKRRQKKSHED